MTALFLLLSAPSQVMRETDTQVKWPSKLKIGAKSKKGDESLLCSSCVLSLTVAGAVQKSAQTLVEFSHRSTREGGGEERRRHGSQKENT